MAGQREMDKESKIKKQLSKLEADVAADEKLKQRLGEQPLTLFKEYGIPLRPEDYNIIRAWKDPNYRNSLSEAERAALPPNPAGAIELSDADLSTVAGGIANTEHFICKIITLIPPTSTLVCTCTSKLPFA
jgi:mersacidin/lichenicidin family type 2 lantibiotic